MAFIDEYKLNKLTSKDTQFFDSNNFQSKVKNTLEELENAYMNLRR